ncbi:hypothetical protein [Glaesserella parasuis]|uniref:hypothetical protein n=1 Tax=Glaesserella parasuis TaxID=738 RepID=UPI0027487689|nr:hypothetical protein [Glaesserella parasuis]
MKDFFILAKWIFGAFVGGVLVSFVETRSFSYKAMLDSLDFFYLYNSNYCSLLFL